LDYGAQAQRANRHRSSPPRLRGRPTQNDLPIGIGILHAKFQHLPPTETGVERHDDQPAKELRSAREERLFLILRDSPIALIVLVLEVNRRKATLVERASREQVAPHGPVQDPAKLANHAVHGGLGRSLRHTADHAWFGERRLPVLDVGGSELANRPGAERLEGRLDTRRERPRV
jgi:hypothetical protein